MPLVSIVTPAYNSASTLQRCCESIRSQTFEDWEHLIVDDGSTDATARMLETLGSHDPRVRTITLAGNSGAATARNSGIKAARGRFIAFIDSDDEWLRKKLETQISFMQEEAVAFSYGAYYVDDGRQLATKLFTPPPAVNHATLLRSCPIGCLTAAYDKDVLGVHYMPNVRRGQDWGLWLALARQQHRIAAYPGAHAIYHDRAGSISSHKLKKLLDMWTIYRDYESLSSWDAALHLMAHAKYAATKPYTRL